MFYRYLCKVPFIKDVRSEGEGGTKIGRFYGQTVLQKCGQGGGGKKYPENFADVFYELSQI